MKPRIYIETTIVSYLTAKPSRNLIVASRQAITRQWWRDWRPKYDLFVSEFVQREAGEGDKEASSRRREVLIGIEVLPATHEAEELAGLLLTNHAMPSGAATDAAHVALAAVHRMEILLTWNCRHIANVMTMPRTRDIIKKAGYAVPIIATPQELLESLGELP